MHSFGPFVIDAERGLTRDGAPVSVGQRALSLLSVLAEAQGTVVAKERLIEQVWPDLIVEEGNLSVQIAGLRKALGPAPDGGEWIVTAPRIGYRLIRSGSMPAANVAPTFAPSLAVLPFANIGGDPEQEYLADGVADDIITALSRFRSFAVIARNSSFIYKGRSVDIRQIAQELGVRYVLEGSVRRAGSRLRISAQLVDGVGGTHIWAQNYDGAVEAIFDFQDQITEAVATVVEPHIRSAELDRSRRERPGSVAAYDVYLRAVSKILSESPTENETAHRMLTETLAKEPDNALLLAHAAWTLEHRITMGWTPLGPDDRQRCMDFTRRALENAGGDPTVLSYCGIALVQVGREYDWGMAVLSSAVDANPYHLHAVITAGVGHLHCGDLNQALALFQRAGRLSPRDPLAHIPLCGTAHVHMIRGSYEEALAWATRSFAVNANFDAALWMLIAANAHLGHLEEARRHLDRLLRSAPGVTIASIRAGQPAKDSNRLASMLEGLRMAGMAAA